MGEVQVQTVSVVSFSDYRWVLVTPGSPDSSASKEYACKAGDAFNSWVRKILWRRDRLPLQYSWVSLVAQLCKESACNSGDLGSILGLGKSPGEGKGYPLQYSGVGISGLENSMYCIVNRVAKSQTQLSDFYFTLLHT